MLPVIPYPDRSIAWTPGSSPVMTRKGSDYAKVTGTPARGISFYMPNTKLAPFVVLAFLMIFLNSAPGAQADERPDIGLKKTDALNVFIKKYNALENRRPHISHPDSPFHPYHETDFEDGLDTEQRGQLRASAYGTAVVFMSPRDIMIRSRQSTPARP